MYTAILYRASTGPEQGFPCVVFPHREKPVFITGFPVDENRFFPVRKSTQGKPCHTAGSDTIFFKSIWIRPQGSQGCQKIRFFFKNKTVEFLH